MTTSLHSVDERSNRAYAYNRLVSSVDGHSEKWMHQNKYTECQTVCEQDIQISESNLATLRNALIKNKDAKPIVGDNAESELNHIILMWLKTQTVPAVVDKRDRDVMKKALQVKSEGMITSKDGSCVIYVDFKRRFGGDKAKCLK